MNDNSRVNRAVDALWIRSTNAVTASTRAILSEGRAHGGDAIFAEVQAQHSPAERLRFAISAACGIYVIAARDALRGRIANSRAVGWAAALGISAATIDLTADSRWPMTVLVGIGCFTLSIVIPRAVWRWPLLTGGILPLMIALTGDAGPYSYDRGDQWMPLGFTAVCAAVGVLLERMQSTRRILARLSRITSNQ